MTTLYLAGPITGTTDYRERFTAAEAALRAAGYDVVNPVDNACVTCGGGGTVRGDKAGRSGIYPCPDCPRWARYVRMGLRAMLACDGVATLPWIEDSDGAMLECFVAARVDLDVAPVAEWVARAGVGI